MPSCPIGPRQNSMLSRNRNSVRGRINTALHIPGCDPVRIQTVDRKKSVWLPIHRIVVHCQKAVCVRETIGIDVETISRPHHDWIRIQMFTEPRPIDAGLNETDVGEPGNCIRIREIGTGFIPIGCRNTESGNIWTRTKSPHLVQVVRPPLDRQAPP